MRASSEAEEKAQQVAMKQIDFQIRIAEGLVSLLTPPEREKIELARAALRKLIESDPLLMPMAILMIALEISKREADKSAAPKFPF